VINTLNNTRIIHIDAMLGGGEARRDSVPPILHLSPARIYILIETLNPLLVI